MSGVVAGDPTVLKDLSVDQVVVKVARGGRRRSDGLPDLVSDRASVTGGDHGGEVVVSEDVGDDALAVADEGPDDGDLGAVEPGRTGHRQLTSETLHVERINP